MDKLKEQFKKLTGETDEELVSSFLLKSQNTVLSKTNRSELIDDLNDYCFEIGHCTLQSSRKRGACIL